MTSSRWTRLGPVSVVLGGVGLIIGTLLFAAQLGPPGLRERISIYPFILWQIVAGSALLHATQPLKLILAGRRTAE